MAHVHLIHTCISQHALTNGLISRVEEFSERLSSILALDHHGPFWVLGQLTENTGSHTSDVLSGRVEQLCTSEMHNGNQHQEQATRTTKR